METRCCARGSRTDSLHPLCSREWRLVPPCRHRMPWFFVGCRRSAGCGPHGFDTEQDREEQRWSTQQPRRPHRHSARLNCLRTLRQRPPRFLLVIPQRRLKPRRPSPWGLSAKLGPRQHRCPRRPTSWCRGSHPEFGKLCSSWQTLPPAAGRGGRRVAVCRRAFGPASGRSDH